MPAEEALIILALLGVLPHDVPERVLLAEDLVHEKDESPFLPIVDRNDHDAVLGEQRPRGMQPRPYHR